MFLDDKKNSQIIVIVNNKHQNKRKKNFLNRFLFGEQNIRLDFNSLLLLQLRKPIRLRYFLNKKNNWFIKIKFNLVSVIS